MVTGSSGHRKPSMQTTNQPAPRAPQPIPATRSPLIRDGLLRPMLNFRVGERLGGGFALIIVAMAVVGMLGYRGVDRMQSNTTTLIGSQGVLGNAQQMKLAVAAQRAGVQRLLDPTLSLTEMTILEQASQHAAENFVVQSQSLLRACAVGGVVQNVALHGTAQKASVFFQQEYTPVLQQIYRQAAQLHALRIKRKQAAAKVDHAFAEILTLAAAFEQGAMQRLQQRIQADYTMKELAGKDNVWTLLANKINTHLAKAGIAMQKYGNSLTLAALTEHKQSYEQERSKAALYITQLLDGNFEPNNRVMWVDATELREIIEKVNKQLTEVLSQEAENFMLTSQQLANQQQAMKNLATRSNTLGDALAAQINQTVAHALTLAKSTAEGSRTIAQDVKSLSTHVMIMGLLLAAVAGFIITLSIIRPLGRLRDFANRLAAGELTTVLDLQGQDEICHLGEELSSMANQWTSVVTALNESGIALIDASQSLKELSERLSSESAAVSQRTDRVAQSSEEMSGNLRQITTNMALSSSGLQQVSTSANDATHNLTTIAAAEEQASTNLIQVAKSLSTATEAMQSIQNASENSNQTMLTVTESVNAITSSLNAVHLRCEEASDESSKARQSASSASQVMASLQHSAGSVVKVVDLIKEIADRTDMLALNASIESARAGEAGLGFGVVAMEVKELARQTAEATRSISNDINAIRQDAERAIHASSEVVGAINLLGKVNEEILDSVREQNSTAQAIAMAMQEAATENTEISTNVTKTSNWISDVNRNVDEISVGIAEVSRSISAVSTNVAEVNENVMVASQGSSEMRTRVSDIATASKAVAVAMAEMGQAIRSIDNMSDTLDSQAGNLKTMSQQVKSLLSQFKVA
ncbi:methyl-accepting chemotaxis sensory transducer [Magnetococcus marinus MC-1]|uniref:Methyl-accepting chemotaxis sensory transducer n=1 Tax=Magnetococcus marinus (strain ATCC BAA-1437 / JCM 17883 / MC-1) TaxID=156889 RepID=A0L8K4_MAGMM|nr:methyl-accepting chemotaxis protein [Magnetococcus marinus]ABK44297.1 methyl-accepting chemotaxis sensory transducer [Magnetococcus marinus MC-1]